jgi:hypothetical protein
VPRSRQREAGRQLRPVEARGLPYGVRSTCCLLGQLSCCRAVAAPGVACPTLAHPELLLVATAAAQLPADPAVSEQDDPSALPSPQPFARQPLCRADWARWVHDTSGRATGTGLATLNEWSRASGYYGVPEVQSGCVGSPIAGEFQPSRNSGTSRRSRLPSRRAPRPMWMVICPWRRAA